MSDMLLEVDEALRAQQIKALWDRYGQWIITAAVLAVICTGIAVAWYSHLNKNLEQDTVQLIAALQSEGDSQKIGAALEKLKKETSAPLNGVVGLYEAQAFEKAGDLKQARASYQAITAQMRQPRIVKELAVVQDVRLGLLLKGKPEELLQKIEKSTQAGQPFRASALELKGLLLMQTGKKEEANKIFEELSADLNAPGSLRQRAKALIQHGDMHAAK